MRATQRRIIYYIACKMQQPAIQFSSYFRLKLFLAFFFISKYKNHSEFANIYKKIPFCLDTSYDGSVKAFFTWCPSSFKDPSNNQHTIEQKCSSDFILLSQQP